MVINMLAFLATSILRLRYRIRLHGLETILPQKGKGFLFLPNHPALIDPAIVNSLLIRIFHPWILVSENQVKITVLKYLVGSIKLLPLPDIGLKGRKVFEDVKKKFSVCAEKLNQGENLVMYPAGHIYRSRFEDLRGNAGVQILLSQCPGVRVVMIRTTGLWGSSFSRSSGGDPEFSETIRHNFRHLLKNLIFFCPRRPVDITFCEAEDIPRNGTKDEINRYLERFYNAEAPGNTYVPYTWWERGGIRTEAEPLWNNAAVNTSENVLAKQQETASVNKVR